MGRLLIVCLLLVSVVFLAQNLQSVSLSFADRYETLPLPIAAWMAIFAITGMLSSLFLLGLAAVGSSSRSGRSPQGEPRPQPRAFMRNRNPLKTPAPGINLNENWQPTATPPEDDEWDLETPPAETTVPKAVPTDRAWSRPESGTARAPRQESRSLKTDSGNVFDASFRVVEDSDSEEAETPVRKEPDWIE